MRHLRAAYAALVTAALFAAIALCAGCGVPSTDQQAEESAATQQPLHAATHALAVSLTDIATGGCDALFCFNGQQQQVSHAAPVIRDYPSTAVTGGFIDHYGSGDNDIQATVYMFPLTQSVCDRISSITSVDFDFCFSTGNATAQSLTVWSPSGDTYSDVFVNMGANLQPACASANLPVDPLFEFTAGWQKWTFGCGGSGSVETFNYSIYRPAGFPVNTRMYSIRMNLHTQDF